MGKTTEFDKLRRQRRWKKRFRRMVAAVLVLAIGAALLFTAAVVYQLDLVTQAQNFVASLRPGEGFPISIRDVKVRELLPIGRDVVLVSDNGTFVYNRHGALLTTQVNQYAHPVVRVSGGKILAYDLGGTGLQVDNEAKLLHSLTTPGRIYAADLSPSGHVATAVAADGFLARVTVYTPQMEERYNWYTGECYITSVSLSQRGDSFCAAGVSGGEGGRLTGHLRFHHTGQEEEAAKVLLPDELVLSVAWTKEDKVQVVTDRAAYVFDADGGELAKVSVPADLSLVENSPEGGLYLAHGDHRSGSGAAIEAYNADLELVGSYHTDRRILSLEFTDGRLLILTEGQLLLGDGMLAQVQERRSGDLYYVCAAGNTIYGITPEGLVRESL